MADLLTRGRVRQRLEAALLLALRGKSDDEPITEDEIDVLDAAINRELTLAYGEFEAAAVALAYDEDDESDARFKTAEEEGRI
jgi:hypothetical protein